jgi:hypothetical protein
VTREVPPSRLKTTTSSGSDALPTAAPPARDRDRRADGRRAAQDVRHHQPGVGREVVGRARREQVGLAGEVAVEGFVIDNPWGTA